MKPLKVGMIGLGSIAQKAYLPILTKESEWSLVGAYSPTSAKRRKVCRAYRIHDYSSIKDLINDCDAVFVHSSTESHFEVVADCLNRGVDVYVDKPLAATWDESERLVERSERLGRKLMVGFNRRFAPFYVQAKNQANDAVIIRIDKHRIQQSGQPFKVTLLDDYIHLVDTALWFAETTKPSTVGTVHVNDQKQLVFARHSFSEDHKIVTTAMHREAGTHLEQVEVLKSGQVIRVKNLDTLETEKDGRLTIEYPDAWQTILKRRGFHDAVHHFVDSVKGDTPPIIDGREGIKAQRVIEEIIRQYQSG
ncbi:Gfo/Idh/MocA family protein [Paludifilum halophilum]|uniref:Virulence factor MviM n=1 Tax=Paludifilum halophilum TaxID=1642702 RepID=A0A235B1Z1_9BACL|nr:Gfo/Idh/MocA family oxidoreductase [Paludifilum halophilum]OYD06304.1 virulence factor MviM [Paludifilum halophilum]